MMRIAIALAFVAATASGAHGERRWLRANFHAHGQSRYVDDDGSESVEALHKAVRAAGFDFSLHSPHCRLDVSTASTWAAQRELESKIKVPGLTIAVGQELTVLDGPSFSEHTQVLGHAAPGNLNHMTIVGNAAYLPARALTPAEACDRVHHDGGICIVNHPGPGPMMWEDGYWETPKNRGHIDALEVYNGQALSAVGIDFESRYREATAYRGLGIKVAATSGADTHGPKSLARAQAKLAGFAGAASKLVKLLTPSSTSARPELDAATLVAADGTRTEDVIAAVKARRTIATYAMRGVEVSVDGLGEVRKSANAKLRIGFSRRVGEVTLYREGLPVQIWHNVDAADWSETLTAPAAYVFAARDGAGRLLTSAIWYEPPR